MSTKAALSNIRGAIPGQCLIGDDAQAISGHIRIGRKVAVRSSALLAMTINHRTKLAA